MRLAQAEFAFIHLFLLALPCRANVGPAPPLPGGTIAPNTSPEMVPAYAPAMAPLPGGTLSPNTPPAMVPLFMPALAPQYIPPPGETFAPNTPPAFLPIIMPAIAPPPGQTFNPNTPPAMIPMFMPAMIPLPGETFSPNTPPAMMPLLMPAMIPPPGETFSPNTPPAMIPMMMPAMIPLPGGTFAPNTPPAMIPLMIPAMVPPGSTLSPNTPPAMMPLLMPATLPEVCFTDNGIYASTSGIPELVSWNYGVTLQRQNITADDFFTRLLPDLEIAFADSLVPTLFDVPGCDTNIRQRSLQSSSAIIGMSSRPNDRIDTSIINCGTTPCIGIAGSLTIFTMRRRQQRSLEEEQQQTFSENQIMVLKSLQQIIRSGRFDNMGDVVGVTYLGPFPPDDGEESNNGPGERPDGSIMNKSRNRAIIGGAVGGGTALLLFAIGSLIIARNRRRDQLGNFPTAEGESNIIPDIEEPVDYIPPGGGEQLPDVANETAEDDFRPTNRMDRPVDAPAAKNGMLA